MQTKTEKIKFFLWANYVNKQFINDLKMTSHYVKNKLRVNAVRSIT